MAVGWCHDDVGSRQKAAEASICLCLCILGFTGRLEIQAASGEL